MKIDLGSFMFNLISPSGGTCSWGTALGQNSEYKIDIEKYKADFLSAMLYKKVSESRVDCNLGKGGSSDDYDIILASIFDKVFVNGKKVEDAKYLLFIVKEHTKSHDGRLSLKYNISAKYDNQSLNENCIEKIKSHLNINDDSAWIVKNINFINQDELHFDVLVLSENKMIFDSNPERKKWLIEQIEIHEAVKKEEMLSFLKNEFDSIKKRMPLWDAYRFFGYKYYKQINNVGKNLIFDVISETPKAPIEIEKGMKIGLFEESYLFNNYKFDISSVKGAFNRLVYGVPGCGKSYYVKHIVTDGVSEENIIRTTFYQDYTNTDFVGQILPHVDSNKEVTYEFNPGPFTRALERAIANPNEMVYLVIEEINRGNAASIFGDIFQLLDRENGVSEYEIMNVNIQDYLNKQFKDEGYSFEYIKIPGNLSIVATMNTSDQNVFTLDNAFKRRWEMKKMRNEFDGHKYANMIVPGTSMTWKQMVTSVNDYIVKNSDDLMSEDKLIGVYFVKEDLLLNDASEDNDDKKKSFAAKVLEYIWDDVAKFDRPRWFGNIKTLDELIDKYVEEGKDVFNADIFKDIDEEAN